MTGRGILRWYIRGKPLRAPSRNDGFSVGTKLGARSKCVILVPCTDVSHIFGLSESLDGIDSAGLLAEDKSAATWRNQLQGVILVVCEGTRDCASAKCSTQKNRKRYQQSWSRTEADGSRCEYRVHGAAPKAERGPPSGGYPRSSAPVTAPAPGSIHRALDPALRGARPGGSSWCRNPAFAGVTVRSIWTTRLSSESSNCRHPSYMRAGDASNRASDVRHADLRSVLKERFIAGHHRPIAPL